MCPFSQFKSGRGDEVCCLLGLLSLNIMESVSGFATRVKDNGAEESFRVLVSSGVALGGAEEKPVWTVGSGTGWTTG